MNVVGQLGTNKVNGILLRSSGRSGLSSNALSQQRVVFSFRSAFWIQSSSGQRRFTSERSSAVRAPVLTVSSSQDSSQGDSGICDLSIVALSCWPGAVRNVAGVCDDGYAEPLSIRAPSRFSPTLSRL